MEKENQIQLIGGPTVLRRRATDLARVEKPMDGAAKLRASWQVIRKRRWSTLFTLMAVMVAVGIWTFKQKPMYEAKGMLEIEQESPNIVTVQDLFQIESITNDYVETQYKILQSDSLARKVIEQLHLDRSGEFNSGGGVAVLYRILRRTPDTGETFPTDAAREQHVLQTFENRLTVEPVQRSRLVRVTFDSENPQLAANAINTLAASYIQNDLQVRWDAAQKASGWLSEQLDGLKLKLQKSEDDMQQYASANGLLYLAGDSGATENIVDQRLRELQDELTRAQADRYTKEATFRLSESGDYGALPGVFDNKVTQDLMDRLGDLERQYAALAPDFKPDYPKMKAIQSQIDRTEQLLQQQRNEAERNVADEYFAAVHREDLVQKAFNDQEKDASVVARKSVQYNIFKGQIDAAIIECLSRGDLIDRRDLKDFEEHFAAFVGAKYAIGVNSGYHALQFSLQATGISRGDEVITSGHTFVATVSAIVNAGAEPVLVDVAEDFNLDPIAVEAAVTPRTRAIIPVSLNGRACDMKRILAIADRHRLIVIEDSAQALGAQYHGQRVGSLGTAAAWSFFPFKSLGGFGDGGAVTTNDADIACAVKRLRYNGEDRTTGEYHHHGETALLDNVQAAVLDVKLPYIKDWIEHRRKIAAAYRQGLAGAADLRLPHFDESNQCDSFQNYVVRTERRDQLRSHLQANGVETLVSWPKPMWRHSGLGLRDPGLPNVEKLCHEVLSLPMSAETTEEQAEIVIECVRSFYAPARALSARA